MSYLEFMLPPAKNLILAGVKSVTLHDNTPTTWLDLAAQFYLSESDIGQPRAAACVTKLAELNPYVRVTNRSAEALASADFLAGFSCIVMCNAPLDVQLAVNDLCHATNKQFIATEVGVGHFYFAAAPFCCVPAVVPPATSTAF